MKFELSNPPLQSKAISHFSLEQNNASVSIYRGNRDAIFSLSEEIELLEVICEWNDDGSPLQGGSYIMISFLDEFSSRIIGSSIKPVEVLIPQGASSRIEQITVLTPKEAREIVFNSEYLDVDITIISRLNLKG